MNGRLVRDLIQQSVRNGSNFADPATIGRATVRTELDAGWRAMQDRLRALATRLKTDAEGGD